jgi:TPR repeat protein
MSERGASAPAGGEFPHPDARAECSVAAANAALRQVREAAHAGDVEAQALFGQLLGEGRGIAPDAAEALHWYAVAANSGHAGAMNMLGRCHELGRGTPVNLELAATWYRKAAAKGLDWGMYNHAQLLAAGRGIARDRAQAFALYRRAADLGHAKSMNLVGRHYEEGWEVEPDAATAIEWYRRAAVGGDFRGQTSYASILVQRGEVESAAGWLRRAAESATPAFLQRLAEDLDRSGHALLKTIAEEMRDRLVQQRMPAIV